MASRHFEIDDSELRTLQVDLRGAPLRIQLGMTRVLNESRMLVEREMKKDARGHRYLRHLPRSVTSEMLDHRTAEIGFEPGRRGTQGRIAHIIVYGSVNNAPVFDHAASLRRATPTILRKFAGMAEDATITTDGGR